MSETTDLEALSQLLSGELSTEAASALRARIAAEPELTAAWTELCTIPDGVAALPDVPMPAHLQHTIAARLTAPGPSSQQGHTSNRSSVVRWATALAAAALVAAVLGLPLLPDDDARPPAEADPSASTSVSPSEEAPTVALFAPKLPPPPRRLPHRPQRYTQPPPGGPLQYQAVDAARNKDCPEALAAVQQGMRSSENHATLYKGAWFCFNDTHQRKLEQARAATWSDFDPLLWHFEGIEYRLEAWRGDPVMRTVLDDLFGAPTVTDHLAKDLHLEALAAEGLAQEHERLVRADLPVDPELVQAWARRVHVLQSSLAGEAGERLDAHRAELRLELERLLRQATATRGSAALGVVVPPDLVLEAAAAR